MSRREPKAPPPRQTYDRALVPVGMATILPHTAQRVRHLEAVLIATLQRWGYREIIPPTFEYLDVLSEGLEPDLLEKCYKFADRTTGRILLLRPDVTAQIARIVAMGILGSATPLRLCYRTTVFRHEPEHAGREREIFQVGAELIGEDDVATDGEIIALLIDALRQLGLSDFKVSLGHVGFFKALLERSGMSPAGQKRAEHAAARKDLPHLEEILTQERVAKPLAQAMLEAPTLYGREEVLERGRAIAGRDRAQREALERLAGVYRLLQSAGEEAHLLLDLGEFRGFEYYDGVVFDVFASGLGCELGGGGRYNHLIGRFGRDLPSTGFALDVDRLFRVLEPSGNGTARKTGAAIDVLVAAPLQQADRALRAAQLLRQAGHGVVQGVLVDSEVSRALEQARRAGASAAVVVGVPGLSADEAWVMRTAPGTAAGHERAATPRKVKLKELSGLTF